MVQNGFSASQITKVETGVYCPDGTIAATSRFTAMPVLPPGNTTAQCANVPGVKTTNAVRVSSSFQAPLYFARTLLPASVQQINAKAIAMREDVAGLRVGSGVTSISTANTVLSALMGGSLNLTAVQYQGLVNANLQALDFFNALAVRLNASAGTYGSLVNNGSVSLGTVIQSEMDVLQSAGNVAAVNALGLIKAGVVGNPQVNLANLFDLGVWQSQPIGPNTSNSALRAGLNVYQLTTLHLQIANGKNAVTLNGIATGNPLFALSAATTVIEPPQSPNFAFGPVGASVHTSQVRMTLNFQLLNVPGLPAVVNVPIYIEVGSADASIAAISCGTNPSTDATVTIAAQSAIANAYLGTVAPNLMQNFSTPVPTVQPATLLSLGGAVSLQAAAQLSLGSPAPSNLVFNQTQIAQATSQTVTSTNISQNVLTNLSKTLVLTTVPSTVNLILAPVVAADVAILTPVLNVLFSSLDGIVDPMLAALGIKLGYADVVVTGVRCGIPALVQ